MSEITDLAWGIISTIPACQKANREASCLYFAAAAAAALRGTEWRFAAGGAFLLSSQITGWGIAVSPRDQSYYCTADTAVDPDDGSYVGHCWVEAGSAVVDIVDIMEGYYGPRTSLQPCVVYHRLPSLTRSIKTFYRERLTAVARAARANREFVQAVQHAAMQARGE